MKIAIPGIVLLLSAGTVQADDSKFHLSESWKEHVTQEQLDALDKTDKEFKEYLASLPPEHGEFILHTSTGDEYIKKEVNQAIKGYCLVAARSLSSWSHDAFVIQKGINLIDLQALSKRADLVARHCSRYIGD